MLTQSDLLYGLGLPALVGAVLFVAFRACPRPATTALGGRDASPFALAAGFLIAQVAILGRPTIPPLDVIEWLSFGLMALVVLSATAQFGSAAAGRYFLPLAIVVVLLPATWLLAQPLIEHTWIWWETIAWLVGAALAMSAMTLLLARLLRQRCGTTASAGLVIVIGTTALVLLLSGTKTYAQLAAAGAAALVPGIVLAAVGWTNPFSAQIVPAFVLVLGGLLLAGHWYASLTPLNALLLSVAPLGLWIGQLSALTRWRSWQRALVELAAVALPALVAFALAVSKFMADTADGY